MDDNSTLQFPNLLYNDIVDGGCWMSDYVKKLRSYPSATCTDAVIYAAADTIEAQAKRIEELEAALNPFAEIACLSHELPDTYRTFVYVSDLRHARKVLGEKESEG